MSDLRPLQDEPVAVRAPFDVRRPPIYRTEAARADRVAAIREALAGVELGAYDERMIEWLAGWDVPTVGGLVSLLDRVRAAGDRCTGGAGDVSSYRHTHAVSDRHSPAAPRLGAAIGGVHMKHRHDDEQGDREPPERPECERSKKARFVSRRRGAEAVGRMPGRPGWDREHSRQAVSSVLTVRVFDLCECFRTASISTQLPFTGHRRPVPVAVVSRPVHHGHARRTRGGG